VEAKHIWRSRRPPGGMGLREFIRSSAVTLKLMRKPTRREFMLAVRITLMGVAAIGGITFIVKFIALAIQGA